jgi:hypothetical protein
VDDFLVDQGTLMTEKIQATASKFKPRFLTAKRGISRAQDTAGYNRLTLTDGQTGSKFVRCGGGYCMTSACLADWANATLQGRLDRLVPGRKPLYGIYYANVQRSGGYCPEHACIEGGTGVEAVRAILAAVGIAIEEVRDRSTRNGKLIGFNVREVAA